MTIEYLESRPHDLSGVDKSNIEDELKLIVPLEHWTPDFLKKMYVAAGLAGLVEDRLKPLRHLRSEKFEINNVFNEAGLGVRVRSTVIDGIAEPSDADMCVKSENMGDQTLRLEIEAKMRGRPLHEVLREIDNKGRRFVTKAFNDAGKVFPTCDDDFKKIACGDTERIYFECTVYVTDDGVVRPSKKKGGKKVVIGVCFDLFKVYDLASLSEDDSAYTVIGCRVEIEAEIKRNIDEHDGNKNEKTSSEATPFHTNKAREYTINIMLGTTREDIRDQIEPATESKMAFAERLTAMHQAGKDLSEFNHSNVIPIKERELPKRHKPPPWSDIKPRSRRVA